jgi:hypothetical protein
MERSGRTLAAEAAFGVTLGLGEASATRTLLEVGMGSATRMLLEAGMNWSFGRADGDEGLGELAMGFRSFLNDRTVAHFGWKASSLLWIKGYFGGAEQVAKLRALVNGGLEVNLTAT